MKYLNILIILAIAFAISSCQAPMPDPDADAVFKSIKKVYTLNEDGSVDYQYQHELKYITHYSFNRLYGESFVVYNPNFQELKINKSLTTMADGKKVASPENAYNEVLPRFAAGAPVFNHLREMVVTHAGLELGCLVDYDYELKTKAGYFPYLGDNLVLAENVPVQNLEVVVKVPEGKTLNYKVLNATVEPKESSKKGFKVYTFKFKNIASLEHASNEPHDASFAPRLIFSTATVAEAINKVASTTDLTLNDDIKSTLDERLKGADDELAKIGAVKKLIGEMNSFRTPIEHAAYKIRPLNEVWKDNGATYFEKTLLFTEFLKYAGLEADPIFVYPGKAYDVNVGNLIDFGHCYVKTKLNGEAVILSASPHQKNNIAFDIVNDIAVDLYGNKVDVASMIEGIDNKITYKSSMKVKADESATATVDAEVYGATYPYFSILKSEDNAKEVISALIPRNMIQKANLIEFDKKGCKARAEVKVKEVWKNQGDYYFVAIPEASNGIAKSRLRTLTAERKSPLHLSYTVDENYDFTLELPANVEFVAPTINKQVVNSVGTLNIEISVNDNQVRIIRNLKINTQDISPEEYPNFKALMDTWNKSTYKEFTLKKK